MGPRSCEEGQAHWGRLRSLNFSDFVDAMMGMTDPEILRREPSLDISSPKKDPKSSANDPVAAEDLPWRDRRLRRHGPSDPRSRFLIAAFELHHGLWGSGRLFFITPALH